MADLVDGTSLFAERKAITGSTEACVRREVLRLTTDHDLVSQATGPSRMSSWMNHNNRGLRVVARACRRGAGAAKINLSFTFLF